MLTGNITDTLQIDPVAGQIAATNALSDIYAMGGEPKLALNLLCVPDDMPKEAVHELLRGGYDKVYEAGTIITGGLLMAVAPEDADALFDEFKAAVPCAQRIGTVAAYQSGKRILLR